jgi:hypothetical protein
MGMCMLVWMCAACKVWEVDRFRSCIDGADESADGRMVADLRTAWRRWPVRGSRSGERWEM